MSRSKPAYAFVAVGAGGTPRELQGPDSNTGLARNQQTTRTGFAVGVDYWTLVFPEEFRCHFELFTPSDVLNFLFHRSGLTATDWEAKKWQFYEESAVVLGPDGKLVGRIGQGSKEQTVCVSLTGAGCALIREWFGPMVQARQLHGHLSRIDLAFDDFEGAIFRDIREVNRWAIEGRFDKRTGRPSATAFMDDHGKGKGSTVYVGSRGRKQLCMYEKGKMLKDKASPWVRCELRLWAADCVIPLEAMTNPLGFLRGGYEALADLLPAEAEPAKPERIARTVDATATGALEFLREQCGPTLALLVTALGPDVWHLLSKRVFRDAIPRRFRGIARDLPHLRSLVRQQLGGGSDPVPLAV